MVTGKLGATQLVFIPRHGRGHRLAPAEVPYRANIFAMKQLGVQYLISVSAVGSMREHLHPGELVIPDQYVDRTQGRTQSFFGAGIVAHVSMADPVCTHLAKHLADHGRTVGAKVHEGGTLITIDGPAFSTRGESHMYRAWGIDIIGMTAMPEAKLAREAEMHYCTLGWVTDYDCWHQSEKPVTVEAVIAILKRNGELANQLLSSALPGIASLQPTCSCASALAVAIVTDPKVVTPERKNELGPLVAKYL